MTITKSKLVLEAELDDALRRLESAQESLGAAEESLQGQDDLIANLEGQLSQYKAFMDRDRMLITKLYNRSFLQRLLNTTPDTN